LTWLIRDIVFEHHRRYGIPRVREELRRLYGKQVSRKKVARLMRENGLNARRSRKFIPIANANHELPVCENLLNRQFGAEKGGQKWGSDITYRRATGGWVYLTVGLDLFDRKIRGWALSADRETVHTTIPALEMAFKNRKAQDGLLFHSDRGVQYCAKPFRKVSHKRCPSVRQSMSRRGNCCDNACAESFFKTLKAELETSDGKQSVVSVRQSAFMYVETYYNRVRIHSPLDYSARIGFNSGNVA
jgi:transposase InsO family protein